MPNFQSGLLFGMLCILLLSCQSETPSQKNILKGNQPDTLSLAIQKKFDYSQLSPDWVAQLADFRLLKGYDRKDAYNRIKRILPFASGSISSNQLADLNTEAVVQLMSVTDLIDLLGTADRVRDDGALVYYLTADTMYRLVFFCQANGFVYNSAVEADS
jgi:hypothetical protein